MPINIPKNLPAGEHLREEKIFVMEEDRARTQQIRPLNILILNLMPEKEKTELQLLRLLGNTPLQVNITFLNTATHESKNVSKSHLQLFYTTFNQIRHRRYDGMIITGAPVEKMPFEDVNYWQEIAEIMDWSKKNVTSVLHICWGAQAALYHHYGIGKVELSAKCSGVYSHVITDLTVDLVRGFSDLFTAPHSRYTSVSIDEVRNHPDLRLLSYSEDAGVFIVQSKDNKNIMITGHLEYDATTLADEYSRDVAKGIHIDVPVNYFPNDDPAKAPMNTWRAHTHLLFSNWLNYYVYQETPYEWDFVDEIEYHI
ncbi:homoserine O-acetyltransferase MetA [Lysinibacillus fusiformis]|uniref:homoserine O-acetyltransferase MetA n=1 Tax=Lysinibacillus fusiformis TaxID=28031 RepID=UPI000888236D|nr:MULTISPECIES: homoserine O-succinyltransferase [Lysinibacillus]MED4672156.1 homoserine O-succinyltransferase [Lysinibacillus fusiformis]QAS56128.1 homoserine O-succinyltransferase [Lysinibacillus sphaericus]RDV34761.1 homoserine O-succinyltransferase [Lysinibacillus fusiformis]SCX61865.1 homoserine O-succinyltransferase [Lysinibacillus fusiformis]SDB44676.1 homoserine O-succinyltransferase [Lysinibacillus fusiformis]